MFLFYLIDWYKRNIVCVQFYQIYYYDVLVLPYRLGGKRNIVCVQFYQIYYTMV